MKSDRHASSHASFPIRCPTGRQWAIKLSPDIPGSNKQGTIRFRAKPIPWLQGSVDATAPDHPPDPAGS